MKFTEVDRKVFKKRREAGKIMIRLKDSIRIEEDTRGTGEENVDNGNDIWVCIYFLIKCQCVKE